MFTGKLAIEAYFDPKKYDLWKSHQDSASQEIDWTLENETSELHHSKSAGTLEFPQLTDIHRSKSAGQLS